MKKRAIAIFTVIFTFFGRNLGDDERESFQANDSDCWYRPSCNLTRSSNASLIPFVAGCKCDVDCLKYNDCCKDSKYYVKNPVRPGKEFSCHAKLEIQMVTSCPKSYPNPSVARNCSFEYPIKDVSLVVAVTNKKTRTTYANKYCALCHNDTDYEPWDLAVDFVQVASSFFEDEYSETAEYERLLALELANAAARNVETESSTQEETFGRIHVERLFPSIRYHPAKESFLADWKGKPFVCVFESQMPTEMAGFVRKCLPYLISECPDDDEKNELCQSYMEIVYDKHTELSFRNKVCAECNSVPLEDASFCPQSATSTDRVHGFVVSSRNKTRNRNLCKNPILPTYFCPPVFNSSDRHDKDPEGNEKGGTDQRANSELLMKTQR